MKILFIGGTGIISSACSPMVVERGHELVLFNRGQTSRPVAHGAQVIKGDIRKPGEAKRLLGPREFDVVVNWIAFTPEQVQQDIDLWRGRTGQYIFISSASVYQKPPSSLPVTESTPLYNPYWEYSRNKIACEDRLMQEYRASGFPITIVRPSHTYDQTLLPFDAHYTVIDRMRRGKKVIIHGDGTSLWVMTHHVDFARAFVSLLGNPHAIGDTFQITSDELLSWNQIYQIMAEAAGAKLDPVHIPSEVINVYDPEWGAGLLGDKAHSMIFDNSKIKRMVPGWMATVPFSQGAKEIMAWYDADPARQVVDPQADALFDRMIAAYESVGPKAAVIRA